MRMRLRSALAALLLLVSSPLALAGPADFWMDSSGTIRDLEVRDTATGTRTPVCSIDSHVCLPAGSLTTVSDAVDYHPLAAPLFIRTAGNTVVGTGAGLYKNYGGSAPSQSDKFSITTEGGSTVWYGVVDVANTWVDASTMSTTTAATPPLTITSTNATATAGPELPLFRDSASPAASDNLAIVRFEGNNSSVALKTYTDLLATITDETAASEDGRLTIQAMIAGALTNVAQFGPGIVAGTPTGGDKGLGTVNATNLYINGAAVVTGTSLLGTTNSWTAANTFTLTNTSSPVTITSTDAGASSAPGLAIIRDSVSPAAADALGIIRFQGNDSGANLTSYDTISNTLDDPTDGSEDAHLSLTAYIAGTSTSIMKLGPGVSVGTATDQGANTLNAGTLYEAGTSLAAKYQPLDSDLTSIAALTTTAFGRGVLDDADSTALRATAALGTVATQNTGTSGANIPFLNGTNTWSGSNVFDLGAAVGGIPITLLGSDAGSAFGPAFVLKRTSASPAVSDTLGAIYYQGSDSGGTTTNYANEFVTILDPTDLSEDSAWSMGTYVAGTFAARINLAAGLYTSGQSDRGVGTINATTLYQNGVALGTAAMVATGTSGATVPLLNGANTFSAVQGITTTGTGTLLTITTTDAGATTGPGIDLYRASASPAAADAGGRIRFMDNDSLPAATVFASIDNNILDPTDGSEDGQLILSAPIAGSLGASILKLGPGVSVGTATDQGANTLNAGTLYQGGTALGTAAMAATGTSGTTVPLLDGTNTWSAANTFTLTTTSAPLIVTSTDAGAGSGPGLNIVRDSASPLAADALAIIRFQGNDSLANLTTYNTIGNTLDDPTDGSEDSHWNMTALVAGVNTNIAKFGPGLSIGTAVDPGVNSISWTGTLKPDRTVTAAGTTGNQTINKPAGTVNFAAGAGTITVTNSLVSTTSLVFCQVRTADTTLKTVVCASGSGSFVITANANATAETSVGFMVTN